MPKDCTLIATLPNLASQERVQKILECPFIAGARFNTGVTTLMDATETVALLNSLSNRYSKPIWLDLKGRQLRITSWADPQYEAIELNHAISVVYPARIYFRGGEPCEIVRVKSNRILVEPLPSEALGAGQSVNILAKELEIDGYLTETDKLYLAAGEALGMNQVMASFVESFYDFGEILQIMPDATIVSKIESVKGIGLVNHMLNSKVNCDLMAARDDLYIETGQKPAQFMGYLRTIIAADPNAICASRIFASLERQKRASFADFADLTLMYELGYRRFMLGDNICNRHFLEAISAWEEFVNG
jgi:pyruvate kinase